MTLILFSTCVLIFIAGVVSKGLNVFWVYYTERGEAIKAGTVAAMMVGIQMFGMFQAVPQLLLIGVFCAGHFCGTVGAVKLRERLWRNT